MDIRIRAWDKELNIMFSPDEIFGITKKQVLLNRSGIQDDKHDIWGKKLDKFELTLFTGFKDKNGIEIFDGDKIKYYCGYDSFGKTKDDEWKEGIVEWDDKRLCWNVRESNEFGNWLANFYHQKEIEIIGNKYATPELLNAD